MIWNLHNLDRCITSRQFTKVWINCTACFQPLLFIVIKYLYCCLSFILGNTIHSTISCIKNSANQYGDIPLKPLPCSTPPLHFTTSPPACLAPKRKTKKKEKGLFMQMLVTYSISLFSEKSQVVFLAKTFS